MEYGYSILMGIFGAALLLYAGLMVWTGDVALLPKSHAGERKDKAYVRQVGKAVAIAALAPLVSAGVALRGEEAIGSAMLVLVTGFIVCIPLGVRVIQDDEENDKDDKDK